MIYVPSWSSVVVVEGSDGTATAVTEKLLWSTDTFFAVTFLAIGRRYCSLQFKISGNKHFYRLKELTKMYFPNVLQ